MKLVILLTILAVVSEAGPVRTDPFSLDTAKWLAQLCAISYCDTTDIQSWSCPTCDRSLRAPTVLVTDAEIQLVAYVTDNNQDNIVVVFKGTDPLSWSQWASDLNFFQIDMPSICAGCKVHGGFYNDMKLQRDSVASAVAAARQRLPNAKVLVTGHSLGAAVAQLFAEHLAHNLQITPVVYTFGNPRVGNKAFSGYYNTLIATSYRINNNADLVPHVPPNAFDFVHASTLVFCTHATNCNVMAGAENDGGILHVSIPDHDHYLGINYFDYLDIGFQSACKPRSRRHILRGMNDSQPTDS